MHAAKTGGEVLLQWLGKVKAREKGPRDLVTEADIASQNAIRDVVLSRFPSHQFVGEEDGPEVEFQADGNRAQIGAEFRWIVDPLDGTVNYVHGMPSFATSVALQRGSEVIVGSVFDPVADECFTATQGGGAMLNGKSISTSDCATLNEALVAASFSPNVPRDSDEVKRFIEVLSECQALRRLGSAALNLSYLAAGRLDAYWATSVKPWDVAAGWLIVAEAGGNMTALNGGAFELDRPEFVAAATPQLHRHLLDVLDRAVG